MKPIPMLDLYQQYKSIKPEINRAIFSVIKQSAYIGGQFVEKFESEVSKYLKIKYTASVNSGTDALLLSLQTLGIKKNDEVITSPFTFFATAEVIERLGAKPVFIDIDENNFNLNPDLIEKYISKKTKAIIPVHLFGMPCNMDKIISLAKKYNLNIVEDACQAIGAKYKNQYTGTFGNCGCFSFFPSKNLGAYGDGGLVCTNNQEIYEKIKFYRNHGSIIKYYNDEIGYSSRLDGIQAAILSVKLKYLDIWNSQRRQKAKLYNKLLSNINYLKLPDFQQKKNYYHIYHQYTLRVLKNKRKLIISALNNNKIQSMIYYPTMLPQLKPFKKYKFKSSDFPICSKIKDEVLSLPISPELTQEQIKYICQTLLKYN